jgi:hypothetical protein
MEDAYVHEMQVKLCKLNTCGVTISIGEQVSRLKASGSYFIELR